MLVFCMTAPTTPRLYTLSLHDALPIYPLAQMTLGPRVQAHALAQDAPALMIATGLALRSLDRKSTRLNSSHVKISYAVFCLKKKKHVDTRTQEWLACEGKLIQSYITKE